MSDAEWVARFLYVNGQSVEKRDTGASWFTRPNGGGQKSIESFADAVAALSAVPWPTGRPDASPVDDSERKP